MLEGANVGDTAKIGRYLVPEEQGFSRDHDCLSVLRFPLNDKLQFLLYRELTTSWCFRRYLITGLWSNALVDLKWVNCAMGTQTPEQPPQALGKPLTFELRAYDSIDSGLRLGTLSVNGRRTIHTPHYIALSSRGAVPHLTQDMMRDNTAISGIYAALEDCE